MTKLLMWYDEILYFVMSSGSSGRNSLQAIKSSPRVISCPNSDIYLEQGVMTVDSDKIQEENKQMHFHAPQLLPTLHGFHPRDSTVYAFGFYPQCQVYGVEILLAGIPQ